MIAAAPSSIVTTLCHNNIGAAIPYNNQATIGTNNPSRCKSLWRSSPPGFNFSSTLSISPTGCPLSLSPPPKARTFPSTFCCFSSLAGLPEMESSGGPSLFPLHRCKIIHLVRHAQGIHNVEGDKNYKAYMKPEYFDAHLTTLGWQQVDNLRKHVQECGLSKRIDLVVVSPMLRTMQTAVGVFGGDGYTDKMGIVPLMVPNTGNSGRAAISSLDSPPFVAMELCREHFGVHPCDKRRDVSEYQYLFPAIDFSLIETDEDSLWKTDVRETIDELAARGLTFLNWLLTRPEKEIAVVTHSGFLCHTLRAFGNDCHPSVKKEICTRFANCELRSMVIADRCMLGSDPSTTNYPGKIPSGPDAPSDVAEDGNKTNSISEEL